MDAELRAAFHFPTLKFLNIKLGEENTPVSLQKLNMRVAKQFGNVSFRVLIPDLLPHPSGTLAFPKVERMAFLLSEETSEALVLVWFEAEDEVFMSEKNLRRLQNVRWQDHARPVKMNQ